MTAQSPFREITLSAHAIDRWIERVDPGASRLEARFALDQMVQRGHVRPTPRHWTDVDPAPGLTLIYWFQRPSVCALVVNDVVVTVLTRELCKNTALRSRAALETAGVSRLDRRPRYDEARWHWTGREDAA